MQTLILGASDKPDRYSNKAMKMLLARGHTVVLVHPTLKMIDSMVVYPSIKDVQTAIDTVTVYVSAAISSELAEDLIRLAPRRVIFNPGGENPGLLRVLKSKGIQTVEACTLVLLQTNQY